MTTKPILLLDIHGVFADLEGVCLERWRTNYPTLPFIPINKRVGQDIRKDYARLDPSFEHLMQAIMREPNFFASLPLVEGAASVLNQMKERYEVFFCTSLLHNPSNASQMIAWVDKHFGPEWSYRVIMTRDKTVVRGNILIDDRPQIMGCMKPSFTHVIFDHHYNEIELTNQRIHGWTQTEHEWMNLSYEPQMAMSRKPVILVDISNVLLDMENTCLNKWREYYPLFPFIPIDERKQHGIIEDYTQLDPLYGRQMEAMIHEPDFFNTTLLMEGAKGVLDEMEKKGYCVFICTRFFRDGTNVRGKLQFIQRHFGQKWVDKTIFTRDKTLIHADAIIDDCPDIVGSQVPTFTHIIFSQHYNENQDDKPRINKWSEWEPVVKNVMINRKTPVDKKSGAPPKGQKSEETLFEKPKNPAKKAPTKKPSVSIEEKKKPMKSVKKRSGY